MALSNFQFGLVLLSVVLCSMVVSGNPADGHQEMQHESLSRAFKDLVLPENSSTNLTKEIINSVLSVLGVFAFGMAFIVIPLLALLYTSSSSGWASKRSASDASQSRKNKHGHVRLTRAILDSDRCIERIVCEVTKTSRNSRADKWVDVIFNNVPSEGRFMKRVSNAYRARNADCSAYTCEPVGFVVRLFIYATDWNTVLKG